ncbi:alkyl hydroperoxide reductase/ thiol specific antioxidant/ Mal allergen [Pyrenochaeta sp. DS3sAY3a]|nr:alkyl hydroperoxide reductase/ thiol specific antioxidant/ Mal allergen [Pyrenochaeta sp. DS3sAY3a]
MAHTTFPSELPVPKDDGACSHLTDLKIPSVSLSSTAGGKADVSTLSDLAIIFCYPRTGAPGEKIGEDWNSISGARGCTPQACSFRDELADLRKLGVKHVFGVSTQDTPYQKEAKERLRLPYELLSDEHLELRLVLAVENGKVTKVWYPVFPPDQNAKTVIEWLESRK